MSLDGDVLHLHIHVNHPDFDIIPFNLVYTIKNLSEAIYIVLYDLILFKNSRYCLVRRKVKPPVLSTWVK